MVCQHHRDGEDPQGWGMPFFGLNQKLHLQHHVAVVVEVAVPQYQALNHQVQPQVRRNQPLESESLIIWSRISLLV
ncbi:hypothetical protein RHMOL_Rhmol04G0238800 [Rhododendron molle]|uniref:Uncharacterized protein n=1 Tax=Rhododendron molle TaxID=49168 RepID=A0ACC0P681_RHOML|nr:hypothetical protein RHMOL_Rhmol04G0238800 [Rhododendron molle]